MMKKFLTLGIIVLGVQLYSNTQTTEEIAVMRPIHFLFDGMKKADTSIVKKAFAKDVIMKSVFLEKVVEEKLENFLNQIANKESNTPDWVEKLYNTEIKIDGSLAHVWKEYSFFVGDKFSHCGVDSFSLIKTDGDWKIVFIMDTRRRDNCNEL